MSASHATLAPSPFLSLSATISTAASLSMNSQTPSVAMITNSSPGTILCVSTTGSAITPTPLTAWSPMLRAMASPTCVCSGSSQTRELRPGSGGGLTNPPEERMRSFSPGLSGFWSIERGTATMLSYFDGPEEASSDSASAPPVSVDLARTARESPQLATYRTPSLTSTTFAVVPAYIGSISSSSSRPRSTCRNVSRMASAMSRSTLPAPVPPPSDRTLDSRRLCTSHRAYWLTSSPPPPCPS
mmetsp:Transcript_17985/g.41967  ORF Transcript_17985/g.41967 Transcript_17985/m.41967 type:complete len:243 (+) Transcript_17985:2142-2870(+)